MAAFTFQPLGDHHDRAAFSCGNAALDDFIKTKARKENALGYCAVFVMGRENMPSIITGYYTLSSHAITVDGIDADIRKKFPKYPLVPTTLLGRLARDLTVRGADAGPLLLMDALKRALSSSAQVGSYAVVVDATDRRAVDFYRRFNFLPSVAKENRLYLPMATIKQLGF